MWRTHAPCSGSVCARECPRCRWVPKAHGPWPGHLHHSAKISRSIVYASTIEQRQARRSSPDPPRRGSPSPPAPTPAVNGKQQQGRKQDTKVKAQAQQHSTEQLVAGGVEESAFLLKLFTQVLKLNEMEVQYILSKVPEISAMAEDQLSGVIEANMELLQRHRLLPKTVFLKEPRLLITHLPEWHCFFSSYGFTEDQFQHILSEAPDSLANCTLVSAGHTMLFLKSLGLDEYGIKQMCVYYPQIFSMTNEEVESIVALVAKHNSTHGYE